MLIHRGSRGSGLSVKMQGRMTWTFRSSGTRIMVRTTCQSSRSWLRVGFHLSGKSRSRFPGLFFADMTSSETNRLEGPLLPQVEKTRMNSGIYDSDAESWMHSHKYIVRALHGILGLCAVLLLPIGIFRIRSSSSSAFSQHRAIQIGMAASCTLAILLGLFLSISSNTVRLISAPMYVMKYSHTKRKLQYSNFHASHQWLGLLLGGLISGQIVLGYKHHIHYMRTREKSHASIAHVILGHYIWAFMTINAFLYVTSPQDFGFITFLLIIQRS